MSNRERMSAISLRTQIHRHRILERRIHLLTLQVMLLFAVIGILILSHSSPAIATVPSMSGSVLLREGVDVFILVGMAAFILGVVVTVICIYYKNRH